MSKKNKEEKQKKPKNERNHGIVYYAVFFALLIALVLSTVLAIALNNLPLVFTAIAVAVVYLGFLFVMHVYTKRRIRAAEKRAKLLGQKLVLSDTPRTVYIIYFGSLKQAKKPNPKKSEFYLEFYGDVDDDDLQHHLYYGLSAEREAELEEKRLGSTVCGVNDVLGIAGKRVYLQDDFYQEAVASLTYTPFLESNKIVVFGRTEETKKREKKQKKQKPIKQAKK